MLDKGIITEKDYDMRIYTEEIARTYKNVYKYITPSEEEYWSGIPIKYKEDIEEHRLNIKNYKAILCSFYN